MTLALCLSLTAALIVTKTKHHAAVCVQVEVSRLKEIKKTAE